MKILEVALLLVTVSRTLVVGSPVLYPSVDQRLRESEDGEDSDESVYSKSTGGLSAAERRAVTDPSLIPAYQYQTSEEHLAAVIADRDHGRNGTSAQVSTNTSLNASSPPTNFTTTTSTTVLSNTSTSSPDSNSTSNLRSVHHENENCTLEPAFLCLMDMVHFQSARLVRIKAIKDYVLRKLGMPSKASARPSTGQNILDQINPSGPFSGQIQTLYASCDLPAGVDLTTWNLPQSFHIYFNIPSSMYPAVATTPASMSPEDDESLGSFQTMMLRSSPQLQGVAQALRRSGGQSADNSRSFPGASANQQKRRSATRNSNVISAKLKLYKLGRGSDIEFLKVNNATSSESCNETMSSDSSGGDSVVGLQNVGTGDEKIRVSVYWYTLPLRKQHYKKKLLDTKMVPVKEAKWVEFDIQKAAVSWLERKENFGLVVQVENEDNEWIDARKFFVGLPCLATSTPQIDLRNDGNISMTDNVTSPELEVLPPPVLEICTLTLPSAAASPSFSALTPPQNNNKPHHQHPRHSHKHRHNHGESHHHHKSRASTQAPVNFQGENQVLNVESGPVNPKFPSGASTEASQHTSTSFNLDADHPLREIFATVASANSNEFSSRKEEEGILLPAADDYDYEQGENRNEREVIIQKIFISPPVPNHHHHHHPASSASSTLDNGQVPVSLNR